MAQKAELKVVKFALRFFPHQLVCIHLHFSFAKQDTGILISVLDRVCFTLITLRSGIFTYFSIKCSQSYLVNCSHISFTSALDYNLNRSTEFHIWFRYSKIHIWFIFPSASFLRKLSRDSLKKLIHISYTYSLSK